MFSANTSQVAAGGASNYIEDVFSTWLYTGDGSARTITNGIDLSTKGGLVWIKSRGYTRNHVLADTVSGQNKLASNLQTKPSYGGTGTVTSYTTTGFTLGTSDVVSTTTDFVSWTFRKQPKFFDVVTGTQSVAGNVTVNHNLGSVPGCIIVKNTDSSGNSWNVYHQSLGVSKYLTLDSTDAASSGYAAWGGVAPTSTEFTLGYQYPVGTPFVAYIFAHNAGGFGLTGTDNVISCGSYTEGASATTITLGYEPQWILLKRSSGSSSWYLHDTMRGMSQTDLAYLEANSSAAESNFGAGYIKPTATGFIAEPGYFGSGSTVIYIAIRRGPMKVPTSGTSVFSPNYTSSATTPLTVTTNFPVDLSILRYTSGSANYDFDRLRGASSTTGKYLITNSTAAEGTSTTYTVGMQSNTAVIDYGFLAGDTTPKIYWNFQRAPSFFDEVCYTGDNAATRTLAHNLTVAPELMIVRMRNSSGYWNTFFNFGSTSCSIMTLDDTPAAGSSSYTGNFSKLGAAPTSSSFIVTNPFFGEINTSGTTYVTYLFATCAGVSKVGSYTGNGSTQTINCGFTGGARFVLIKRTDSTGDWYTYDTARGMTTLTDPYLLLNSTAAESATLGSVTTVSTGFALNAGILAAINTNGANYIFLAVS